MSNPGGPYQQGSAPDWNQQGWGSANPQPSADQSHGGWNQYQQQGSAAEWNNQQQGWGSATPQPSANQWDPNQGQYQQQGGWDSNQGQYQQQGGWDQQQGSQWASSWQDTSQTAQKKGINPIIPIVVALAVLLGGVGIWALTRGGDDGGTGGGGGAREGSAEAAVRGFFDTMNMQDPLFTEFEKYVTEVGSLGLSEATDNSPGGKYEVKQVGEEANGKVPVVFTHNGTELKGEFAVKKEGDTTKLVKPFASLIVEGAEDGMSFSITENGTAEYASRRELYYPGIYTIKPLAGYGSKTLVWEPVKKEFPVLPGESKEIKIVGKPTDEYLKEAKDALKKSLDECLGDNDFLLFDCPFKITRPSDADYPENVEYRMNPRDAAEKAKHIEGTALSPCFEVSAGFNYEYSATGGTRKTSPVEDVKWTGCYNQVLSRTRWKK